MALRRLGLPLTGTLALGRTQGPGMNITRNSSGYLQVESSSLVTLQRHCLRSGSSWLDLFPASTLTLSITVEIYAQRCKLLNPPFRARARAHQCLCAAWWSPFQLGRSTRSSSLAATTACASSRTRSASSASAGARTPLLPTPFVVHVCVVPGMCVLHNTFWVMVNFLKHIFVCIFVIY